MRRLPLLLAALACTALSFPRDQPNQFTLPAEFDSQQAVWMSARPTESGKPVLDIVIEMVSALAPHVRIQLMVPNEEIESEVRSRLRRQKIDERQVNFWTTHGSPTSWYRD